MLFCMDNGMNCLQLSQLSIRFLTSRSSHEQVESDSPAKASSQFSIAQTCSFRNNHLTGNKSRRAWQKRCATYSC